MDASQDALNELTLVATIPDLLRLADYLELGLIFIANRKVRETSHNCFCRIDQSGQIGGCALAVAEIGRIGDPDRAFDDFRHEHDKLGNNLTEEDTIKLFAYRIAIEIAFARAVYYIHKDKLSVVDIIAVLRAAAFGFSTPFTR